MLDATQNKPPATAFTSAAPRPTAFIEHRQGRALSSANRGDFRCHEQYHDAD